MTSSTQSPARSHAAGFTLAEVLIAATLSAIILAAVLSSALFIARGSYRAAYYSEMDQEARKVLELFARDTRMAQIAAWTSQTSLTLTIPTNSAGGTESYRYIYDSAARTFTRQLVAPTAGTTQTLVNGVSTFAFKAYQIDGTEVALTDLANANARTKQIQLSLKSTRTQATIADTTTKVFSARFILRNKHVTS